MRQLRWSTRSGLARAFTLVEVCTALVVIAILAGIAAAVYSDSIGDRRVAAVEGVLSDVTAAQRQLAADFGSYTTWDSDLGAVAASAHLVAGQSTGPGTVSAVVGTRGTLGLAGLTEDGRCVMWRIDEISTGGSQRTIEAAGPCSAAGALPAGEQPAAQVASVRLG